MTRGVAEQVLNDVLAKYGASACDTPQMLESFLRKHGRACPREVEVLAFALHCGVVSQLRSEKKTDTASLTKLMALEMRIPQDQAEWVVATWAAALMRAPVRVSTGPAATHQPGATSLVRSAVVLVLAAATGVIGYFAFAP